MTPDVNSYLATSLLTKARYDWAQLAVVDRSPYLNLILIILHTPMSNVVFMQGM